MGSIVLDSPVAGGSIGGGSIGGGSIGSFPSFPSAAPPPSGSTPPPASYPPSVGASSVFPPSVAPSIGSAGGIGNATVAPPVGSAGSIVANPTINPGSTGSIIPASFGSAGSVGSVGSTGSIASAAPPSTQADGQTQPTPEQQQADQLRNVLTQDGREGYSTTVYLDSTGNPTVGIGHKVTAADGLKVGDTITPAQVDQFFAQDTASALNAARTQAAQAGITDNQFIGNLAAVDFQLGNGWTRNFPNTWNQIVQGNYSQAADMLNGTLWQRQTPVRVQDFQNALRALAAGGH